MDEGSRIGASIAALRRDAGLSQAEVADIAGAPLSTVRGIELGAIEPPASLVRRLAAAITGRLRDAPER